MHIQFASLYILFTLFSHHLVAQTETGSSHPVRFRFDFGPGPIAEGWSRVMPATEYTEDRGYGFIGSPDLKYGDSERGDLLTRDNCTGDTPFYFTVDVPEGNYRVIVTLGDHDHATATAIKAESRRLLLEEVQVPAGEYVTRTLAVNVRDKEITAGREVRLTHREIQHLNWDGQLTLEFNGRNPAICALEIIPATDITTLYLAGNSTVTDQKVEPWASWGQMLPCFFDQQQMVVANHAESGESLKRFSSEGRLDKILTTLSPGDYLFIQFGHNDQKPESSAYVKPYAGYQEYLRLYVNAAREKGAFPVLITPVNRRTFGTDGTIVNSHGDYPQAMRDLARSENVPLIDLHAMSAQLFEALGPEESQKAFVHVAANTYPGQDEAIADDSHFSNYGAYELAKCIVLGVQEQVPGVAVYLQEGTGLFDPARPDLPGTLNLPVSPPFPFAPFEGN